MKLVTPIEVQREITVRSEAGTWASVHHKRNPNWAVGSVYLEPREDYVCYQYGDIIEFPGLMDGDDIITASTLQYLQATGDVVVFEHNS